MRSMSIATVATLIDQSERTLRRRIADGTLSRTVEEGSNRTLIPFNAIRDQITIPLEAEDYELISNADTGNAEAQNELALLFLSFGKPENAMYWLELSAKQDSSDAMHWLGRCYIEGNGVPKDDNLGMMWLAKAAAHGHEISQAQMQSIRNALLGKSPF
jgi:uncharacterized protein